MNTFSVKKSYNVLRFSNFLQHPLHQLRLCIYFFFLSITGPSFSISPFIYHWEPAKFDRNALDRAHEHHELHRRRKRSINYNHHSADYGPSNVIHLNFFAHDR